MPLPMTPTLDDLHFQAIVDEAKRRIPIYCPEWTDHNVSDPGVALIELFAWMTEQLIYRVNQVPDRMYLKFLEMIGISLKPPEAAYAPVTLSLTAPLSSESVTIPTGMEIATIRQEDRPLIVFTVERPLTLYPAGEPTGAFTEDYDMGDLRWTEHNLKLLGLPDRDIPLFPEEPSTGDAFYLALDGSKNFSDHVLALVTECEEAKGAGIKPEAPPWEWQVWQGPAAGWVNCWRTEDYTGGFTKEGVNALVLYLPKMAKATFQDHSAYWIRCRLTDAQAGEDGYRVSPRLKTLVVETRGGTVGARHALTVADERLGYSNGRPGQVFQLQHAPVLELIEGEHLEVELKDGTREVWERVPNFSASKKEDWHYTLDYWNGVITLPPAPLQPDGSAYRFGRVPPEGSVLRFTHYRHGGGSVGNVPVHSLTVLRSSIKFVKEATNWSTASGGSDIESLEAAKLRAPRQLGIRTRAVTADDYEYLALEKGVSRAYCLAPGAQPGNDVEPKPGRVAVVILPQPRPALNLQDHIPPGDLIPARDLRDTVREYLQERCPLGIDVDVQPTPYVWVAVEAILHLAEPLDPLLEAEVRRRAEAELYRYLNPYVGGPQGQGWPFGRPLHAAELTSRLQQIRYVEFVQPLKIIETDSEGRPRNPDDSSTTRIRVPPGGLICSSRHRIDMIVEQPA